MENLVRKADMFAEKAHGTQKRKFSEDLYILHPRRVASRLESVFRVTEVQVAAALLHDVIEDCGVTAERLKEEFGSEVADLVVELTEDKSALLRSDKKKAARVRISKASYWAKVIKLIDRNDNLNDMEGATERFFRIYVEEARLMLNEGLRNVDLELEKELADTIEKFSKELAMPLKDYPNLDGETANNIVLDLGQGIKPRDSVRLHYGPEELAFLRDVKKEFAKKQKKTGRLVVMDVRE